MGLKPLRQHITRCDLDRQLLGGIQFRICNRISTGIGLKRYPFSWLNPAEFLQEKDLLTQEFSI